MASPHPLKLRHLSSPNASEHHTAQTSACCTKTHTDNEPQNHQQFKRKTPHMHKQARIKQYYNPHQKGATPTVDNFETQPKSHPPSSGLMDFWTQNILALIYSHHGKPNKRYATRKHAPKYTTLEEIKNDRTRIQRRQPTQ